MSTFWLLFFIALILLPGLNASTRGHRNAAPIWIITILLGWTVIGWIVALIWSATDNVGQAVRTERT